MKKILVPTDFSAHAKNAAQYALNLTKVLRASLTLCNTYQIPIQVPFPEQVGWSVIDHITLARQSCEDFIKHADAFSAAIDWKCELGTLTEVVNRVVEEEGISLVVMGMSGVDNLSRVILGSNSRSMINEARGPVLLIPQMAVYQNVRKIAFATDLSKSDIQVVHSLASFARHYEADILLAYVGEDNAVDKVAQGKIDEFLNEVTCKINYPRIYFRHIQQTDIDAGLDWLTDNAMVDMLVMVHHRHSLFEKIFRGGHTQHVASHTHIPLLVYPADHLGHLF